MVPGAGSPPANGNGNGGGKGKQAPPKGREVFRSQRRESEVRSPESVCGEREVPAGGRRRLRGYGPAPLPLPESPRERAPAGAPLTGLWALQPLPSPPLSCREQVGAFEPPGLRAGRCSGSRAPGTFQRFMSPAAAARRWEVVPLAEEQTGAGRRGTGARGGGRSPAAAAGQGSGLGPLPPPRLPSRSRGAAGLPSPSHAPVWGAGSADLGTATWRANETGFRRGPHRSERMGLSQEPNPHIGVCMFGSLPLLEK